MLARLQFVNYNNNKELTPFGTHIHRATKALAFDWFTPGDRL